MKLMHILKKLGLGVAVALLPVMLFAFGSLVGIFLTLGQPDTIKTALDKSGIYKDAVPSLLKQLGSDERPQESKDRDKIPLEDPKIQAIVQDAFAPDYLKQQVTNFIDGTYAVIQGKSKSLDFEINLLEAKTRLANGLGTYAEERLATLPACTSVESIDPNGYNPLNATCVPPGVDKAAAGQKVRDEFLNNQDFLKDPVINANDLGTSEGNKLDENLDHVAKSYGLVKTLIWATGILAVLLAVAIVFWSAERRTGIRRASVTFISVGAVGAILAWAATFILGRVAENLAKASPSAESNTELQAQIVDVIRLVSTDVRNWWIWYGVLLVVAGLGALIAMRFIRRPNTPSKEIPAEPASDMSQQTLPKPTEPSTGSVEKPPKTGRTEL